MQSGTGVVPGVQEMPDPADGVELLGVPEAGQVVVCEEADEGIVVVLVDGFEGVFALGLGGGGGVGFCEGFVGIAPFLGEVGPGNCGGEEADGGRERGGGGRVEGEGGLVGEGIGDGKAPVDEGAENLIGMLI